MLPVSLATKVGKLRTLNVALGFGGDMMVSENPQPSTWVHTSAQQLKRLSVFSFCLDFL